MATHRIPVVLTTAGAAGNNEDVVGDNVSVVNAMHRSLLGTEEIAANALRSYFVDFYITQALDGGFAQYAFMAPDREELDRWVREGLAAMGAVEHLDLFDRCAGLYDRIAEDELEGILGGGSSSRTDGAIAMDDLDAEFEDLFEDEDVTGLNAAWLRGQACLLVLEEPALAAHIAERAAGIADLEQRQAAVEEALEDVPEFELIIRELCDVAGHQLEQIILGDPDFEQDGETTLAWRFTTDQGEFVMIEDDFEAVMINPQTREVIAVVEFELDEDQAEV